MSKRNKQLNDGFVFSTDPNFKFEEKPQEAEITLEPGQQQLKIRLDTRHRSGKAVTLINGFVGTEMDIETLGKQLKNHCGAGGSVKDGSIIVQGDHREKIKERLHKNGYAKAKIV